jgi:hypothetical protein
MKLWPIVALVFVALALFSLVPAQADTSQNAPTPLISTNEGGCWDKCKTCESKCKDKQSCKENCWSTNDSCCKGAGGKGVYKMCGCTDN